MEQTKLVLMGLLAYIVAAVAGILSINTLAGNPIDDPLIAYTWQNLVASIALLYIVTHLIEIGTRSALDSIFVQLSELSEDSDNE